MNKNSTARTLLAKKTARLAFSLLLMLLLLFPNKAIGDCPITGTWNSSTLPCGTAPLVACGGILNIGDDITSTTFHIDSNFDLSCLGQIQFIIHNNATVLFDGQGNTKLNLAANSQIIIEPGGSLQVTLPCSSSDKISIGGVPYASCNGGWQNTFSFDQLNCQASTTITLGNNPSVCQGTTSANLTYSATTGSPDQYSIIYNAAAHTAGFVDVSFTTLLSPPSQISLIVPGTATAGVYYGTLTVRKNNSPGCVSIPYPISVTVNAVSVGGTATNNQTICSGESPIPLNLNGYNGTIQWQSSTDNVAFANISGATATPLTSAQMGSLTVTTYYRAVLTSGLCPVAHSTSVKVTVYDYITITSPTNKSGCSGDQVTFSAGSYSDQVIYHWQRKVPNGNFEDIEGTFGSVYRTPVKLTINKIDQNGNVNQSQYRVIIAPANNNSCEVTSDPATLTVYPLPTTSAIYHQ